MEIIRVNFHERALQLEDMEMSARDEYRAALRERGGN
jgi:hypothetical protein